MTGVSSWAYPTVGYGLTAVFWSGYLWWSGRRGRTGR